MRDAKNVQRGGWPIVLPPTGEGNDGRVNLAEEETSLETDGEMGRQARSDDTGPEVSASKLHTPLGEQ